MIYSIYILALLGFFTSAYFLFYILYRTITLKKMWNRPKEFHDTVELMGFIRMFYECKVEHNIMLFGFVELVYLDDILLRDGLADEETLNVDVVLITHDGLKKVNTGCAQNDANLKKGDFVAVLPFHNMRHNLWYYITIAKLRPFYLGKGQGFQIEEVYTDF